MVVLRVPQTVPENFYDCLHLLLIKYCTILSLYLIELINNNKQHVKKQRELLAALNSAPQIISFYV